MAMVYGMVNTTNYFTQFITISTTLNKMKKKQQIFFYFGGIFAQQNYDNYITI